MATRRKKQPSPAAQSAEPEVNWAIMRLRKWETAFEATVPTQVVSYEGSVGFIEVFDTYENAKVVADAYDEPTEIVPLAKGRTK